MAGDGAGSRFVLHSLGALVAVHDRRYAQNHLLDVVSAAHLLLDPEAALAPAALCRRLEKRLGLAPGSLAEKHVEAARARLRALGLVATATVVPG
ncbi:MAG: hypothetical protein KatS3mg119_0688 [Rhodothalassiaceae bacterium]|nr:MAG: hypothetical protein KatS3mg119_0688 [Rhodothalassiaceae bacterium]